MDDGNNRKFWKSCGQRIAKRRKELKLNRGQVSEAIGISEKDLGQIERGEHGCKLQRMVLISQALNMSLDDITSGAVFERKEDPKQKAEAIARLNTLFADCTVEELNILFDLDLNVLMLIKRCRSSEYENSDL